MAAILSSELKLYTQPKLVSLAFMTYIIITLLQYGGPLLGLGF